MLATITVLAATREVGSGLVALTVAFSVGVAIPLLAFALAGQQMGTRIRAVRTRTPMLRRITGGVLVVTSVAIWFGVADQAQRLVPGYVAQVQARIEDNDSARRALGGLSSDERGGRTTGRLRSVLSFDDCERDPAVLADCGPARPFVGISAWLNTAERQAADHRGPAGPGRAGRLLDLLVHQLPAHAALPDSLGRPLPRPRA